MSAGPLDESHGPAIRMAAQRESLLPGTRLGDFEIVRTLGIGGFGTVYLARDRLLERDVAIKEYLTAALAYRAEGLRVEVRAPQFVNTYAAGLRSFVNEARILARFNHAAVVKVHCFWEANGTAYMVMPWVRGPTLREVRRAMKTPPTEAWLRGILDPLLEALALLHAQGIYHRDIAPDNVLLPAPGEPVLLDFGAARRVIGDRTQAITAVVKPSFAPIEQYAEAGQLRQGPWTDLYALGAVVVYLLTAVPPPPSTVRSVQDELPLDGDGPLAGVSANFLAALRWALAIRPQDRPQSVQEFRSALDGLITPPLLAPQDRGVHIPAPPAMQTLPRPLVQSSAASPESDVADEAAAAVAPTPDDDDASAPDATPSPAWGPTVRLTLPAASPVLPAPLIKPARRVPPRALALAGVVLAALAGGIAFAWVHRGPVDPPVATWRALGRQAIERVEADVIEEVVEGPREVPPPRPVTLAPALPTPPPLRAVAADANASVGDARAAERQDMERVAAAPLQGAKSGDKRGNGPAARKGGSSRNRSAAVSRPEPGPQEVCGGRSFFGRAICINRECESPRFMKHPHCVELRRQWEERRMRGERP